MPPQDRVRSSAQRRLAAQRAEAARKRRQLIVVGVPVAVIVLVVVVLVGVKLATGAGSPTSGPVATAVTGSVIHDVTTVPASTLNAVGQGSASVIPKAVTAPALTADGKPKILYVGAEYCPYCATERWAVVVALSRFGTFSDLGQTASSANDVYPSTATLSFHGASYVSKYLAFTGKEIQGNTVVNGQYATLDTLSAADEAVASKYDAAPYFSQGGAIPFIDIGGRYLISGASYSPAVLQGKTHAQIAAALSVPSSPIAQGADGTANLITAAICKITNGAPAAVCSSSGVTAASRSLSNAG